MSFEGSIDGLIGNLETINIRCVSNTSSSMALAAFLTMSLEDTRSVAMSAILN